MNIYAPDRVGSDYVGKKTEPRLLGFVYAQVFPEAEKLSGERQGQTISSGATLILRRGAGVNPGDLAGIFGEQPDSRVLEIRRSPSHITVRTQRI
ncbi:MAG: hypothetical protein J6O50_10070 [Ruminiclostridium sp.]|nr:hypothetical protein [Ruminiclostridium sp.]